MSLTAPGYWTCKPQSRFHDHIRGGVGLLRADRPKKKAQFEKD